MTSPAPTTEGRTAPRPGGAAASARAFAPFGDHPRVAALSAAVGLSFSGILYALSGTSPVTGTFFRSLLALPLLAVLYAAEVRAVGSRPIGVRRWAWLAGVSFALDLVLFHLAILLVGAGLATVLSNLQVVIVLVAAWLLWGERPSKSQLVGVPIALVGVVLISGILQGDAYGRDPVLGTLAGIGVAASYAAYLLLIRKGRDPRHVAGPILDATTATCLTSLALGLAIGELDPTPGLPALAWLLLLALSAQVAGGLLLAVALPRLPALTTSVLLLVQPLLAVLLAMLLLGESPSAGQLAGIGCVVVGVALGALPAPRRTDARTAPPATMESP